MMRADLFWRGIQITSDQAASLFGFGGTFAPFLRASERPMAMACLGLWTVLPLRPLLSFPCFISFISASTLALASGLYLRPEFVDLLAAVFLAALRAGVRDVLLFLVLGMVGLASLV